MTTRERFEQIEKLYHAALERDPDLRREFLDGACRADGAVRAEVEALRPEAIGPLHLVEPYGADPRVRAGGVIDHWRGGTHVECDRHQ